MPEKFLGLDIGSETVQAVVSERQRRGGMVISGAYSFKLSETDGLEGALRRLFAETGTKFDRVVTALPLSQLITRHVQLPFRDRKRINEILPFELAPQLSHPMEDMVFDFLLVGGGEVQDVLAVLAPRVHLQERLALFKVLGTDGIIIEAGGFALGLAAGPHLADERLTVILDLGGRETTSLWLERGQLIQVRPLAVDGYGSPEAEAKKDALDSIALEIKNTHAFLRLRGWTEENITGIYLTGGGSLDSSIGEKLASLLDVPVSPLDLAQRLSIKLKENVAEGWVPALMDQALALALRPRGRGLDLARQERQETPLVGSARLIKPLAAILTLALLLFAADTFLAYQLAQDRLEALKGEVAAVFKHYYPEAQRMVDPVSQMKTRIEEMKKETAGLGGDSNERGALFWLNELSIQIPPALDVIFYNLTLDETDMNIKGQAKDFQTVEKVRESLMKSQHFSSVSLGATNLLKDTQKVEFDLTLKLKR